MVFAKTTEKRQPIRSLLRRDPSEYVYQAATLAAVILLVLSAV
jgi:hypothetical protein